MNADDLEEYVRSLGLHVERLRDANNIEYTVVCGVEILAGGLRGKVCDVALQRAACEPYVTPSAIHTRPALVRMDTADPLGTQGSALGSDWQYWSRRFDHLATPQRIWAHVLTILGDKRWVPA